MPAAKNFLVGFFILPFCNFFAVAYAEEVDSYFAWKIKNPDDTPDEKLNLINQARVYCGLGELDKCFEIVEKIYPQIQENFGETDFETLSLMSTVAEVFFMLGNTKTAEKFLHDAKSTKIFNTHPAAFKFHKKISATTHLNLAKKFSSSTHVKRHKKIFGGESR